MRLSLKCGSCRRTWNFGVNQLSCCFTALELECKIRSILSGTDSFRNHSVNTTLEPCADVTGRYISFHHDRLCSHLPFMQMADKRPYNCHRIKIINCANLNCQFTMRVSLLRKHRLTMRLIVTNNREINTLHARIYFGGT